MKLEEKIKTFPDCPGVYIMRSKEGNILYVGKAISLRKRIVYYFKKDGSLSARFNSLMSKVKEIEYLTCSTEEEALMLECDLIKRYHPRYNISLRDDKQYPFLKITLNEDYPRIFITRIIKKDGARYFGPYTDVKSLRHTLKLIKKVFPLRSCHGNISKIKKRPCLYFQIGECLAPCQKKVDKNGYQKVVKELCSVLEGRKNGIIKNLGEEMEGFSQRKQYEKAAKVRDRIKNLQKVIFAPRPIHWYGGVPGKGENVRALKELKNILGLNKLPDFIQCLDVSNIKGEDAVGAVVSFKKGLPDRNNYRRFKIKLVKKIDDYAMLAEVLKRHFRNLIERQFLQPDLLVIDGGRGHLNRALDVLRKLKVKNIPVLGLAKKFEYVYISGKKRPLKLVFGSPGLSLLQRLRDEAHRCAHLYFLKLRGKKMSLSSLDNVSGIGADKKRNLLKFFGALDLIKKASLSEIEKVDGIGKKLAGRVKGFL